MSAYHKLPFEALLPLLRTEDQWVLLDTGKPGPGNRYSYLFLRPGEVLQTRDYPKISELLEQAESAAQHGLWAAGLVSYEAGYALEPAVARLAPPEPASPLIWMGLYEQVYIFDHRRGTWQQTLPDSDSSQIAQQFELDKKKIDKNYWAIGQVSNNLSREAYFDKINRVQQYIRQGETYQVNFSSRFGFDFSGSPLGFYQALRRRQRVPYSAIIRDDNWWALSLSPELFFEVNARGRIITRPMKGTLRRGSSAGEDRLLQRTLARDEKNLAENLMIVDLLRNDLGRICQTGSVKTSRMFAVEKFDTLFQMTSTVEGQVKQEIGFKKIMEKIFPSGSITGAPKIRTMQIIAELEDTPRGAYTGAIGLLAPDGSAKFNVAIRTVELDLKANRGVLGVGGGIIADSEADAEFEECNLKSLFLTGLEQRKSQNL